MGKELFPPGFKQKASTLPILCVHPCKHTLLIKSEVYCVQTSQSGWWFLPLSLLAPCTLHLFPCLLICPSQKQVLLCFCLLQRLPVDPKIQKELTYRLLRNARTYICTHMPTHIFICMYRHVYTLYMCAYISIHIYIHAQIHTYSVTWQREGHLLCFSKCLPSLK